MTAIVHKLEPITLVGAGPLSESDLIEVHELAPTVVAADGGAAHCLNAGLVPDAVIGDMDSLDAIQAAGIPWERLHEITEQESTDFDKALRHVAAPLTLAVGFSGGRMDHALAVFSTLVRHAARRCILIGEEDVICVAPPHLTLTLEAGTRVSLFPMRAVTGRSMGLKWPIDGINFAPDGMIGTSNAALGPVTLQMDGPGMLLILPRRYLRELMSQVLANHAEWPAP